ncbi:MAG: bacteriocin secretion accessory protein [Lactobacillaceae bacterium]|jgi:competence factor transport accessory protein ComB|nr:bacteriocin secretion accessory protein [Lactobacillaceae bacterium]
MFDEKKLESAEFYNIRFRNFSTKIIIPIFGLLIFLIGFSIFTKRELVVTATGEIMPKIVLATIQSTSNNPISEIKIVDNMKVKKGQTLILYKDDGNGISKDLLSSEIDDAKANLTTLDIYRDSVENGKSKFTKPDEYGYSSLFDDYLAQKQTLVAQLDQQVSDKDNANQQADQQKKVLSDSKDKNDTKIKQLQQVQGAIQSKDTSKLVDNPYKYIYDDTQKQTDDSTNQDPLSLIQSQIDELQNLSDSYAGQIAGVAKNGPTSQAETNEKIASLKSEQLSSINKDKTELKNKLSELTAKQKANDVENNDNRLTAPNDGYLHIDGSLNKIKYLPKGSAVAEIYPKLVQRTKLVAKFYIPVTQLHGVRTGEKIRFEIARNISKPLVLNGKIIKIPNAPIETKKGNVYELLADVKIPKQRLADMHYGLEGKVSVIKGKKTWFNYLKDELLNEQ